MFLADRRLALGYRAIAAVVVAWGIGRVTGLFEGRVDGTQFLYFTVLSNVLCLVWFALLAVVTARDLARAGARGASAPWPRWAGAVMMSITVTMLIYLVVLVPEAFTQNTGYRPFTLTDDLVHIVTPVLTILDWALFVPKGSFRWYDPPLWALIPYAYLVLAFAYGAAGGVFGGGTHYPYPFMEVDRLGVGGVALWLLVLTIALEAVAYLYVVADRMLGRAARRMPRRGAASRS